MSSQKRLVYDIKSFVEKVFLPILKKTDAPYLEWSRFSQIISNEAINYDQLHQFVESVNGNLPSNYEKREIPLFKKKKEEAQQPITEGGFNPSKTFGGERARMIFNKGEMDDFGEQKRQGGNYPSGMGNRTSTQSILPGLQKLCKMFVQNQQRMENIFNTASKSPIKKY